MNISIFDYKIIYPFKALGLTGSFWAVHIDTLLYTWVAMIMLVALAIVGRNSLKKDESFIKALYEIGISFFVDLCKESFVKFKYSYFVFIISLFLFTFACCAVGLLPFLDEATKDLNTTFALGLTSFVYVQVEKIRMHGIKEYIKEYFQPFVFFAPINLIGELAKIVSMSFRLFGNILGGGVIFALLVAFVESYHLAFYAVGIITLVLLYITEKRLWFANNKCLQVIKNINTVILFFPIWAQMFFGIFEGLIQSFVIMMLTITYLAMSDEQSHEAKEGASL